MRYIFIYLLFLIFFFTILPLRFVGEYDEKSVKIEKRISIPEIELDVEICYFEKNTCLNSGVWMKYFDYDGNILLTGHSFNLMPLQAGVFYALSDLKVGDPIYITLNSNRVYIVEEVFVTSRYDLEVENFENSKNTLVLYSCFPLWSATERIVVRATLCNLCAYGI